MIDLPVADEAPPGGVAADRARRASGILRRTDLVIGLLVVVLSSLWFLWRIGRPFPWEDEGATVIVLSRPWHELLAVWRGADAPLFPYYLLNRAWLGVLHTVFGIGQTMGAVRSLSAVAAALAVGCVYAITLRWRGRTAALLAALVFAAFPGVSRYAQEARPYALLMFGTTLSWLAWDWWRARASGGDGSPTTAGAGRRGVGYALVLAATAVVHLFGLLQWPAQLLATWLVPAGRLRADSRLRWRTSVRAGLAMTLALLLAAVPAAIAAHRGTGGWTPLPPTIATMARELVTVVFFTTHVARWLIVVLIVTVLIALSDLIPATVPAPERERRAAFAAVLLVWFCVPFVGGALAGVLVRPALIQQRYWMPLAAPLAILAAMGLFRAGEAVVAITARWGRTPGRLARAVVVVLVPILVVSALWSFNQSLRGPSGHGRNPTGVIDLARRTAAQHPGMRVAILPYTIDASFYPVDAHLVLDNPLLQLHPGSPTVWPLTTSKQFVAHDLARASSVMVIFGGHAATTEPPPSVLVSLGYHAVWRKSSWPGYSVVFMQKATG